MVLMFPMRPVVHSKNRPTVVINCILQYLLLVIVMLVLPSKLHKSNVYVKIFFVEQTCSAAYRKAIEELW